MTQTSVTEPTTTLQDLYGDQFTIAVRQAAAIMDKPEFNGRLQMAMDFVLAKKKAEAVEGRYELPSKKPSPLFEDMAEEYLEYYRANRRPRSVQRHEMSYSPIRRSSPYSLANGWQTSIPFLSRSTSGPERRQDEAR